MPGLHLAVVAERLEGDEAGHRHGAACSNVRLAGLSASESSAAVVYSAYEPFDQPKTSSPTANRVTPAPTASTVPATSVPRTAFFGLRRP